jgi:hypothetical protein
MCLVAHQLAMLKIQKPIDPATVQRVPGGFAFSVQQTGSRHRGQSAISDISLEMDGRPLWR